MEHQRALDERDQKHQRFMSDSNSRMQLLHDDAVATLGKGIFDESMQAQKLARKLEREKRQALEQAEVEKRQLQKERHVLEELVKRQVLEEEEAERRAEPRGQNGTFSSPQLASCGSEGRAWRLWAAPYYQEEAGPLRAQPPPRVLERSTSTVIAFGPSR